MSDKNFLVKNGLTVGTLPILDAQGNIKSPSIAGASSTNTGALQVVGGVGIGGGLVVGGVVTATTFIGQILASNTGSIQVGYATTSGYAVTFNTSTLVATAVTATSAAVAYSLAKLSSAVVIDNATATNSTNTGALTVLNGGVGIGGGLFVGGTVTATNIYVNGYAVSTSTAFNTSTLVTTAVFAQYITAATTSTTQVGYAKNLLGGAANQIPFQSNANATTFSANLTYDGTALSAGIIKATNASSTYSTNTGALQVVGGAGIAGGLYVGGTVTATNFVGTFNPNNTSTLMVGWATTASYAMNLVVGTVGSIVYQSDYNVTTSLPISTTVGAVLASSGSLPQYVTQVQAINGTGSQTQATGQSLVVSSGGLGVTGASYFSTNVGIGGTLYLTGDLYVDGTQFIVNSQTISSGDKTLTLSTSSTSAALAANSGLQIGSTSTPYASFLYDGSTGWVTGGSAGGALKVTASAGASSTTTGALQVVNGGVGVGGGGYFGGTVTATNFILNGYQVSTGTINTSTLMTTAVFAQYITAATTSTTQVGYSANLLGGTTGQFVYQSAANTTAFINTASMQVGYATTSGYAVLFNTSTLVAAAVTATSAAVAYSLAKLSSAVVIDNATSSTNTATGALTVLNGGVGIGGNLNIGGTITTTGAAGGIAGAQYIYITGTAGTASTNTGALTVAGGAGIAGGLVVGGILTATNVYINGYAVSTSTSFNTGTLVTTAVFAQYITSSTTATTQVGYATTSGYAVTFNTSTLVAAAVTATSAAIAYSLANTSTTQVGYAANLLGGAANQIPFQSNANATSFSANLTYDGTSLSAGAIKASNAASTYSTNTGALQVVGGAGIAGGLYVGGIVTATNFILNGYQVSTGTVNTSTLMAAAVTATYAAVAYSLATLSSTVIINNATASTSTTTGALQVVNGGVGIGGNLSVGGIIRGGVAISDTAPAFATSGTLWWDSAVGNLRIYYSTTSSSAWIDAVPISGGISNIIGGTDTTVVISTTTATIWNTSTLQSITNRGSTTTNTIAINNATGASSTNTGALQIVNGGLGVGGGGFFGGTVTATNFILNGYQVSTGTVNTSTLMTAAVTATSAAIAYSLAKLSTAVVIDNATASTSTNTGALTVLNGGVGVGGGVVVGGTVTATNLVISGTASSLTFVGTSTRIIGDFSNTTTAYRAMFQTSTPNSVTRISAIPSGTGNISIFTAYNNSDPTNAGTMSIISTPTANILVSSITGAGTQLPMTVAIGSTEAMRVDTSTNVMIGYTAQQSGALLSVNGGLFVNGTITATNIVAQVLTIQYTTVTTTLVQTDDVIQTYNATGTYNTTTGALQVSGGVGVGGGGFFGGVVTATNFILNGYQVSTGTVNTSTLMTTAVTATSAATAYSTIGSHTTGTGIYGTTFNGSTSVQWSLNTSTLIASAVTATSAAVAYSLAKLSSAVVIDNATSSTNTATGALTVLNGGVGIGGNLNVGGYIATNGAAGGISGATYIYITGTAGASSTTTGALQVAGGVGVGGGLYVGGTVTATTFVGQVLATNTSTTQVGYATTAGYAVSFNTSTLVAVAVSVLNTTTAQVGFAVTATSAATAYSLAKLSSAVVIDNATPSTTTATGALTVLNGGVGIGGSLNVGSVGYFGINAAVTNLTNPSLVAKGVSAVSQSGQYYTQAALLNGSATGSADWIAYTDTYPGPSNDQGWIDMGITGANFSDPAYTLTGKQDGYIFVTSTSTAGTGNLVLATGGTGSANNIIFGTGGFLTANEKMRLESGGALDIGYTSAQSGAKLSVNGGTYVNGTVTATNFILNGYQVSTSTTSTLVATALTATNAATAYSLATLSTTVIINNATSATSTNTGALQVLNGGAGIGGNLYVGGTIYSGGAQVLPTSIQEFTATAGQTIFTVSGGYTVGSVIVNANGVELGNSDIIASNGTTVTLTTPRAVGDIIRIVAGIASPGTNINSLKAFSVAMSVALGS